ncbi:hypothetical protein ACFWDI_12460 [Streptomyces sp. NPDC060064]|uniref:hypothetical protein n=1 Tax=Streptomyces sp. NPDC060064 TaxID=3347049 RepID=UPI00368EF16F
MGAVCHGQQENAAALLVVGAVPWTRPHLYFNPKGGTFGTLSRGGVEVHHEEVGLDAYEKSPDSHWLYRFWDWDKSTEMWDAHTLAYAADMAGLWATDRRAAGWRYPKAARC